MADITISVDNATFDQWTASLSVLQRSYLIPLVFTASIPGVASPPAAVDVTGERLLLDVGRACSRPEILDDPGRLFAVLRYASAVSDRYPVFTLTKPFWRLDTHKKKVLSDEFGCGAAFLLASELFGATTTIDLETAVANGWIATLAPKSRRPDYAVRLPTGGLVILEAKGTQSGPSYASDQLTAVGDECVFNYLSMIQCDSQEDGTYKSGRTRLGAGCTLGVNTFVHYGVTMGDGSVLAADSFLMKGEDVPARTRWGGNPAREMREMSDERYQVA